MTQGNLLTERKATALKSRIDQAVIDGKKNCLVLAELIHESYISTVDVNGKVMFVYEAWGYKTWAQYVRTEIGMFKTTANAWRKVWRVFGIELQGMYETDLVLPIGKMVILANANLTPKNVNSMLRKARDMTILDLKNEIKGGNDRIRNFSTSVTESDLRKINAATRYYQEYVGEVSKGKALRYIVEDWYAKQKKQTKRAS